MVILLCQAFFTFHSSVSTVDIGLTATEMRMACNFLPDIHTKWTPEGALLMKPAVPLYTLTVSACRFMWFWAHTTNLCWIVCLCFCTSYVHDLVEKMAAAFCWWKCTSTQGRQVHVCSPWFKYLLDLQSNFTKWAASHQCHFRVGGLLRHPAFFESVGTLIFFTYTMSIFIEILWKD
jgi:hypothetical protein